LNETKKLSSNYKVKLGQVLKVLLTLSVSGGTRKCIAGDSGTSGEEG
jgi:hypothetical protein